jgi:serine/threonine protein kinase
MNKSNKLFSYEIVKKIGEGAFGEVLLATKDGKELAIKKLSKKQIIKVRHPPCRSTNSTNPSSKSRYSTN